MTRFVSIDAAPARALVDEIVHINITGLLPRQAVTAAAILVEKEKIFISHAFFVADASGEVDFDKASSIGGTYQDVEPMGLFWSMKPSSELQGRGIRLHKEDVSEPFVYDVYVLDGHHPVSNRKEIQELEQGFLLAKTVLKRYYQSPDVTAIPIKIGKIRGMLFIPKGNGPFPGIIDMFGGAGGLIKTRAALLASRGGFAALALAYFAYDDLPKSLEIHYEYFEEAIEFLHSHPLVSKSGIGIVAVCKGATLALQMAVMSNKIRAVVAINPSFFHHSGMHYHHGVPQYTFEPEESMDMENFLTEEGISFTGYLPMVADSKWIQDALIPVEKAENAQFLLVFAEDDRSSDYANLEYLVDRLNRFGKSNYQVLSYPGAGHLIEPPYTPHCRASYFKLYSMMALWGGEPKSHAIAQEHSWREMIHFLHQQLDCHVTNLRKEPNVKKGTALESKL